MKKNNNAVISPVTDKKIVAQVTQLLTENKLGYTDTSAGARGARNVVLRYVLEDYATSEKFVNAVTTAIDVIMFSTNSPLEVADCIKAWGYLFPTQSSSVLNGLRNMGQDVIRASRHNSEGLLLGSFEITKHISIKEHEVMLSLLKYLAYNLRGGFWDSESCTVTPAVSGRLSQSMSQFTERLWLAPKDTYQCLRECSALIHDVMEPVQYLPTEFSNIPQSLHHVFIREFLAKLYLSATPYYRWLIMKNGLTSAVNQFTEDASCKKEPIGKL